MPVDREKIAQRISEIQAAIDSLEGYAVMDAARFLSDGERVAAAKYHLLTMIEGCMSICTHIATKQMHKVPEGYGTCFKLMSEGRVIDDGLSDSLSRMAGFRNLVIHQYWAIDNHKVHKFIGPGIKDVKRYIQIVGEKYLR
ncbi:MAG: DUF86 domain-containing protein [Deltaproteobacteria bacterium]|nr:DUF86 domain-containing protein [Deltaproteobacteria bacterium]